MATISGRRRPQKILHQWPWHPDGRGPGVLPARIRPGCLLQGLLKLRFGGAGPDLADKANSGDCRLVFVDDQAPQVVSKVCQPELCPGPVETNDANE